MTLDTNRITEVVPGVYCVLLWCPESYILQRLLEPEMPLVLCWDHQVGDYTWREFSLPILEPCEAKAVLSRVASFDFILPTERFLEILPRMRPAIKAVQLATMPPGYLDMGRIRGKELYNILADCGWHLLLDTPANDYGQILSPNPKVLELAIEITRAKDEGAMSHEEPRRIH
jgi:hypothetical protein